MDKACPTLVLFAVAVLVCTPPAAADDYLPGSGYMPEACMDGQGNVHLVYASLADVFSLRYMRYDAGGGRWSNPVTIPHSSDLWELFGHPKIAVGPDGIPHVVWGVHGLTYLMHATATNQQGTSWSVEWIGPDWVAFPDVAVDPSNRAHFVFARVVEGSPTTWMVVYRDPWGGERHFDTTTQESQHPVYPYIKFSGYTAYITWEQGPGDRGNVRGVSSSDWGNIRTLAYAPYAGWYATFPNQKITARGVPGIVFFGEDWNGSHGVKKGVFYTEWDWGGSYSQLAGGDAEVLETWIHEADWYPALGFDGWGTRYVGWTYHDHDKDACYYISGSGGIVELAGAGDVTMAAGPAGAVMIRAVPSGGQLIATRLSSGPVYYPPTATIDDVIPDSAYTGVDTVQFWGSAWDNDEGGASIVAYEWRSNMDGWLSAAGDFSLPASNLSIGTHSITFRAQDDEGEWGEDTETLVVVSGDLPPAGVTDLEAFDTPQDQGGSITLTWTKSADDGDGQNDVAIYRVERRPQGSVLYNPIAELPPGTESRADTTVRDGVLYVYRVVTVDGIGQETPSPDAPPAMSQDDWVTPPSDFAAIDAPDDQGGRIQLDWTLSAEDGAGVDDVVEYRIMRATSGDTAHSLVATVSPGTQSYVDETVDNLVLYSFLVRAVDDDGNLGDSSPVSATPHDNVQPEPVPDLDGMCIGLQGWVFLRWDPSPDDTTGAEDVLDYRVRRRSAQGASYELISTVTANEEGQYYYLDQTTLSGARYYYLVRAFDGENVSDDSEIAEIYVTPADDGPNAGAPDRLVLAEVTPNPVRDEVHVTYGLPAAAEVTLTLRNVRGQTVAVLETGLKEAGYYATSWRTNHLALPVEPGVMLLVLDSGDQRVVRRLVVTR